MAHTYDVGDAVRCTGTFTDAAGLGADPTTVVFTFRDPSYAETSYTHGVDAEILNPEVGVYYVDIPTDVEGTWRVRWEGTGANMAAGEAFFIVRPSKFT